MLYLTVTTLTALLCLLPKLAASCDKDCFSFYLRARKPTSPSVWLYTDGKHWQLENLSNTKWEKVEVSRSKKVGIMIGVEATNKAIGEFMNSNAHVYFHWGENKYLSSKATTVNGLAIANAVEGVGPEFVSNGLDYDCETKVCRWARAGNLRWRGKYLVVFPTSTGAPTRSPTTAQPTPSPTLAPVEPTSGPTTIPTTSPTQWDPACTFNLGPDLPPRCPMSWQTISSGVTWAKDSGMLSYVSGQEKCEGALGEFFREDAIFYFKMSSTSTSTIGVDAGRVWDEKFEEDLSSMNVPLTKCMLFSTGDGSLALYDAGEAQAWFTLPIEQAFESEDTIAIGVSNVYALGSGGGAGSSAGKMPAGHGEGGVIVYYYRNGVQFGQCALQLTFPVHVDVRLGHGDEIEFLGMTSGLDPDDALYYEQQLGTSAGAP